MIDASFIQNSIMTGMQITFLSIIPLVAAVAVWRIIKII